MQGESRRRVETIAWVSFYQIELHLAGMVLSLVLGHRATAPVRGGEGRGEARNGHSVRILISRWLLPTPSIRRFNSSRDERRRKNANSALLSLFPRLFFRDPPAPSRRNQFTRTQRFARSRCLDVARQPETDRSNPPRSPTDRSFFPLCFTAASTPRGTPVKNRHGYRNSYGVNKRDGDRVVSRAGANRLPGDVRSFRRLSNFPIVSQFFFFQPFISISFKRFD